jgi:hypothetical protein
MNARVSLSQAAYVYVCGLLAQRCCDDGLAKGSLTVHCTLTSRVPKSVPVILTGS